MNRKTKTTGQATIYAPFNEELPPQKRTEICIETSKLITQIATYIICYSLVNLQETLKNERMSVAHAFLQRVTTTHLCNQKLTAEGIVCEFRGEPFLLHEEYKTMTLTRSVYEHLAMFYFLFEHPKTVGERDIAWKYWQINSKKNLLDYNTNGDASASEDQQKILQEIEQLRNDILTSYIGQQCQRKLDEWTKPDTPPANGSIDFQKKGNKYEVRKLPYGQAWKYLFNDEEMALFYRHLSMHCHPVYNGLIQFQNQPVADQGYDGIPLHFSSCFLAHLCRLFLKQLPHGDDIISQEFSKRDLDILNALAAG